MSESCLRRHFLLWACLIGMKTKFPWSSHSGVINLLARCPWGPVTANGVDFLNEIGCSRSRCYSRLEGRKGGKLGNIYGLISLICQVLIRGNPTKSYSLLSVNQLDALRWLDSFSLTHWEKKESQNGSLLESNFENRLSFVMESHFFSS